MIDYPDIQYYALLYEYLRCIALFFSTIENQYATIKPFEKILTKQEFIIKIKLLRHDMLSGTINTIDYNFDYFVRYVEYLCSRLTGKTINYILFKKVYDYAIPVIKYYETLLSYIHTIKVDIKIKLLDKCDFKNDIIIDKHTPISEFISAFNTDNKFNFDCFKIQENEIIKKYANQNFLLQPNIGFDKLKTFDYFLID